MSILLKNATYINWENLQFSKTNIFVEEGKNGSVKFLDSLEGINPNSKIIDCTGKYVTKSFAVGHHHIYSALSRGMPAPKKSPNNFLEILKYIWWTLDKALNKDMIEARKKANLIGDVREKAIEYEKIAGSYFDKIRYHIDKLELTVDNEIWPLPKYRELLFSR